MQSQVCLFEDTGAMDAITQLHNWRVNDNIYNVSACTQT
jgi:hypothetical protein